MESTKKRPRSCATEPYWRLVSRRAMSTVPTMFSMFATTPPMASGPTATIPLTNGLSS